jgi:hypothetical protein
MMTNASIAKFISLRRTDVAESYNVTWDAFLDSMATAPVQEFAGQMEHGGWSPVVFDPPVRLKDNVRQVSALVLDYDKAATWDAVYAQWSCSYGLLYTTKSHGVGTSDRLRVVLPLERAVTAAEYAKIWQWASKRSTCPVDEQTKDASRFWYDPTIPPGGWRAAKLTGKPIDPDPILAMVEAPQLRVVRSTTPPPASDRERRARAYLERIPGAVSGDGGHTATFNAVATVMIGFDLDAATAERIITEDFNPRCEPPWSERELQHKIKSVAERSDRARGYLLVDRPCISNTQSAASCAPAAPDDLEVDWTTLLLCKRDQSPRKTYNNTAVFVRHHPDYRGKWALDTMTQTPWFDGAPIVETFIHELRTQIEQKLGYTPSVQDVEAAIATAATDRPFHPIRQYLRSLDWDGVPRLSEMARIYLGAVEPHHSVMVRKFMVGAAARALNPGCKLDTALMLVGAQGIGKSTFFSILGGDWHADSFVDISNKDSFIQIHSAWLYELAELENVVTGRAESRLKAWITSAHDTFRAPFARTAQRHARAVVLCGTTNRSQFLTDDTGSRRFWIVPVAQRIPRELLVAIRDQLWAEALAAAESGESWWLDEAADVARERANVAHHEEDAWHSLIVDWLAQPGMKATSVSDVLRQALKVDIDRQDRWSQMRCARGLQLAGWVRQRDPRPPRQWRYVRHDLVETDPTEMGRD